MEMKNQKQISSLLNCESPTTMHENRKWMEDGKEFSRPKKGQAFKCLEKEKPRRREAVHPKEPWTDSGIRSRKSAEGS